MVSSALKDDICVAIAGEALIDLIGRPDGTFLPCMGGAPYNLARALARQGVATIYLNPLSADRFGRELANQLQHDGVCLAQDAPVAHPTSIAVVSLNELGHPDYAFYREGVADRQVTADGLKHACDLNPGLKIVCTGALALDPRDAAVYSTWLRAQRVAGHCVVVDANLRPSVMHDLTAYRSHVLATLAQADLIKVSDEDLVHLGWSGVEAIQGARDLLQRSKASMLTLTMGAAGAWLLTPDDQWYAREMDQFLVVDAVGAGDCFLAGLLAALLKCRAQDPCAHRLLTGLSDPNFRSLLRHALSSASLCVQQQGCVPPSWQETLEWSQNHPVFVE
ncbi:MAG: PfkB family carbohydrate kinase [Polaromonas sp.]